eukprot:6209698-Pleurochrysis_carterae.AAC.1
MGYLPRSDRIYPTGSSVLRGAGCHDNGDHVVNPYGRAYASPLPCTLWTFRSSRRDLPHALP